MKVKPFKILNTLFELLTFFLLTQSIAGIFLFVPLVKEAQAAPSQNDATGVWSDAFSDMTGISSSDNASIIALPSASSLDNSTRLNEYLQFAFRANDVLQDEFTDYFTTTTQTWGTAGESTEGLGMLISTYVALYNKNPSWLSSSDRQVVLNRAKASANKLITYQFSMSDPDVNKRGGFEIHPHTANDDNIYVWGTAPDVTALVSLYQATGDETYKTAAINGAEWLLKAEDPSVAGKYRNHYDFNLQAWVGSNEMDSAVAGAFFQVYSITNDSKYYTNAVEAADRLIVTGDNYWDSNSHYSLYAARDGLLEAYRYINNITYLNKVIEYEATLSSNFAQNYDDAQAMRMEYELYELTHNKYYLNRGSSYAEVLWNVTYKEPTSAGRYNVAQNDSNLTYLSGTIPIWILEAQALKSTFDSTAVALTSIADSSNIALSSNGTNITTEYTEMPGGAGNLIDGNYSTKDYVAGTINTYKTIKLTFPQTYPVSQIKLYLAASTSHRNYTYWVETSVDDTTYATVVSETTKGEISSDTWYTENISPTIAKYVIIHIKSAINVPGVWEAEVYAINRSDLDGSIISSTITPQTMSTWSQLAWSDIEPAYTDIKYQVKYQSGGSWILVPNSVLSGNSVGFDTSPVSLTNLNGIAYPALRLTANLSTTYSSTSPAINSWQISWLLNPSAPTIGTPTVLSSSAIRWNFTDSADNETGFRVYTNADAIATSSATADLTHLDETSLSENTQYTRYVKAYNSYGESASSSATSTYTLADTPVSLETLNVVDQSITVSVDTLPNATSGLSGYYFSQGTHNSGWIQTNSWQDTGLSCGTSYTYSVKYRNGDGIETSAISQPFRTGNCAGAVIILPQISQQTTTVSTSQTQVITTVSVTPTSTTGIAPSSQTNQAPSTGSGQARQVVLQQIKFQIAEIQKKLIILISQLIQLLQAQLQQLQSQH